MSEPVEYVTADGPKPKETEFLPLHPTPASQELFAVVIFALLTVLLRWKALFALTSGYLGGFDGDPGLYVWLMKSNARDLFHLPWFNTQAFFPYTRTLAWSDNFILPSLLAAPFVALGAPLVIVYNAIMLGTTVLNGYCTYRLSWKLTGKFAPALLAGTAFMTMPFLTMHLGHPQLQFAFWMPVALLAGFRFLSRPNVLGSFLMGLCVFGAFLTTVYYATFIVVMYLALFAGVLLLRPSFFTRNVVAALFLGGLLGGLPLLPFLPPYFDVLETFGSRGLYEAFYFAATALSYLSSPQATALYGATSEWTHPEALLFPGFILCILAIVAFSRLGEAKPLHLPRNLFLLCFFAVAITSSLAQGRPALRYLCAAGLWGGLGCLAWLIYRMGSLERKLGFSIMTNRALTAIVLLIAYLSFAISFGPLGNPEKGQYAPGVYTAFYYALPGMSAIRAVSRIGILTMLALSLLSSLAASFCLERRTLPVLAVVALTFGIVIEHYTPLYPIQSERPAGSVFDYLHQIPLNNEAIAVLPMTDKVNEAGQVVSWSDFAKKNVLYMNWVHPLKRPLVNGYSGQRSKLMKELPADLAGFPDDRSIKVLQKIGGLRYLVYASSEDPEFDKVRFSRMADAMKNELQFLSSDEDGNYLFELLGTTRIGADTYVLVPSFPKGALTLEFLGVHEKDEPEVAIDIFLGDGAERKQLDTVVIKADGQSAATRLPLPETEDRVRPLKVGFRVRGEHTVLLHRSRFDPD